MDYHEIDDTLFGRDASFDPRPARTGKLIEEDAREARERISAVRQLCNLLHSERRTLRQSYGRADSNFNLLASNLRARSEAGGFLLRELSHMQFEFSQRDFYLIELRPWLDVSSVAPIISLSSLRRDVRRLMNRARMEGWIGLLRFEYDAFGGAVECRLRIVFSAIAWADDCPTPLELRYDMAGTPQSFGRRAPSDIMAGYPQDRSISSSVRELIYPPFVRRTGRELVAQSILLPPRHVAMSDPLALRQLELHAAMTMPELLIGGGEDGSQLYREVVQRLVRKWRETDETSIVPASACELWGRIRARVLPSELHHPVQVQR